MKRFEINHMGINFRLIFKILFVIGIIYLIISMILMLIISQSLLKNIFNGENIEYIFLLTGIGFLLLSPKLKYDFKEYRRNNPHKNFNNILFWIGCFPGDGFIAFGIILIGIFLAVKIF